jgi:methyl-accepting chemotaxis protein
MRVSRLRAEAMRARVFAVVASEVRALAQRSADAAHDVKARVTASAEQVQSGVELVNAAVPEMDGTTQQNAAMVEEATAAAQPGHSRRNTGARGGAVHARKRGSGEIALRRWRNPLQSRGAQGGVAAIARNRERHDIGQH